MQKVFSVFLALFLLFGALPSFAQRQAGELRLDLRKGVKAHFLPPTESHENGLLFALDKKYLHLVSLSPAFRTLSHVPFKKHKYVPKGLIPEVLGGSRTEKEVHFALALRDGVSTKYLWLTADKGLRAVNPRLHEPNRKTQVPIAAFVCRGELVMLSVAKKSNTLIAEFLNPEKQKIARTSYALPWPEKLRTWLTETASWERPAIRTDLNHDLFGATPGLKVYYEEDGKVCLIFDGKKKSVVLSLDVENRKFILHKISLPKNVQALGTCYAGEKTGLFRLALTPEGFALSRIPLTGNSTAETLATSSTKDLTWANSVVWEVRNRGTRVHNYHAPGDASLAKSAEQNGLAISAYPKMGGGFLLTVGAVEHQDSKMKVGQRGLIGSVNKGYYTYCELDENLKPTGRPMESQDVDKTRLFLNGNSIREGVFQYRHNGQLHLGYYQRENLRFKFLIFY